MNKEQLVLSKLLVNILLPTAVRQTISEHTSKGTIGECLYGLLKYDKEFNAKFSQLVSETEQRFRKEFDEL